MADPADQAAVGDEDEGSGSGPVVRGVRGRRCAGTFGPGAARRDDAVVRDRYFREPGFSKERRLDPQITVGLLTDATGMPLMIDAFEGNPGRGRR